MSSQGLPWRIKFVLTLAVFVGSGAVYYSQPLLPEIGEAFHVNALQAGVVSTATLLGFVLGLLLLVPLADLLEKRRLILTLLVTDAVLFLALSVCPWFHAFVALSFLLGLTSMVSQIIIPYVARLSPPHERGRNLGTVLSGALTGVLAARSASGVIAEHFGWHSVFVVGAAVMVLLAAALARTLPVDEPAARMPYKQLIGSVWHLFATTPVLRSISFTGACMYAAMTGFWATLAFRLSGPSFHLGPQAAGLFGFVGAAGALSASLAGPLSDRMNSRTIVRICIGVMALAYLLLAICGNSLAGMIVGVVLLDMGAQAATVSNQTAIYRLSDASQSRLNTVYKIIYNGGGAIGTLVAAWAWQHAGWTGVCISGLTMLSLATAITGFAAVRRRASAMA